MSSDVSVVVQGALSVHTQDVLASVRRHLPDSQLILSTWDGSVTDGLDADVVVHNADPGSAPYRTAYGLLSARFMNTNRMLRSTREGLRRADRPLALKLRSDSPLNSAASLDWFSSDWANGTGVPLFKRRILTISVATRPSVSMPALLFHPSDCVHLGLTSDLRRLWEVPEIDEKANTTWSTPLNPTRIEPRYYNEQVLWLGALAKGRRKPAYHATGFADQALIQESEMSIAQNFVVLEPWQFGVALPKLESMITASSLESYLWHDDWARSVRSPREGERRTTG